MMMEPIMKDCPERDMPATRHGKGACPRSKIKKFKAFKSRVIHGGAEEEGEQKGSTNISAERFEGTNW
jgi:hypothetical protein